MENEKKSNNKLIIVLIIVVVIALFSRVFLIGGIFVADIIFNNVNTKFEVQEDVILLNKGKVEIKDYSGFYDEKTETYYITGILSNNDSKDYSVSLTYRVFDKDKNILGEAYSNIGVLNVGESWKFKVPYVEIDANEVDSFELESVDIY